MNNNWPLLITIGAAVLSFAVSAFLGRKLIPVLHKLKFGQTILDLGPSWHKQKQGTPTMGGILFISGTVVAFVVALMASEILLPTGKMLGNIAGGQDAAKVTRLIGGLLMALLCGVIGFVDDYIKIVKKRNLGLTSGQKLLAQLMVSAGYGAALFFSHSTTVYVPFAGNVDFGIWIIPFAILVIIGASNATNLTDGIDGLCGTLTFVATCAFLVCSGILGARFGEAVQMAAFAGGLLGFLLWNLHPARVFMGDTGSLFIGGMLCAFAFGIGRPFLLLPIGIVYICETLSVILQVGYFKLTHGKRLFKMTPIHHHFEMSGFSEQKIVWTFSALGLIGGALGVLCVLL